MKTKRVITALLAGTLAVTAALSASAATLTDEKTDGSTEVTAVIRDADSGDVSYIITIPDKVDFGKLTQPETNKDSNKYLGFEVVATELNNLGTRDAVSVFLKDSSSNDDQFYLTQKDTADPFKISYDVYANSVNNTNITDFTPINQSGDARENGYHLCTFTSGAQGAVQDVTLVLNQKALFGQNLDDIAGNYSGTLTFHSKLTTLGG